MIWGQSLISLHRVLEGKQAVLLIYAGREGWSIWADLTALQYLLVFLRGDIVTYATFFLHIEDTHINIIRDVDYVSVPLTMSIVGKKSTEDIED